MKFSHFFLVTAVLLALGLIGCSTKETQRKLDVERPAAASRPYYGPRSPIAVGKFDNRSDFMRGLFTDGVDRLGGQAKTILIAHLTQTNRFTVLDRDNMVEAAWESSLEGESQDLMGASYLITGDVTEFGRKEVGDRQFYGIIGSGKKQIAYSKVTLNVVDTKTMAVAYAAQGAGEYELSEREVLGFGTYANYDSTLNGKVLDLAIREAVDRLAEGMDMGAWRPVGR